MAPSAIRQRIYENYATTGVSPLLYVPDASVAIKWFLREAVAPDLLRLEIAHVLRKKTHSGLDSAEALEAWKDLNAVPIEWVPVQPLLDAILIDRGSCQKGQRLRHDVPRCRSAAQSRRCHRR